ncbi:hypothetical protein [Aetokthonos hydrillicola]|nr:hypothetical protein [Aetokthonos hydrillicola]
MKRHKISRYSIIYIEMVAGEAKDFSDRPLKCWEDRSNPVICAD